MDPKVKQQQLGTSDVRWDLSEFYAGIDDPQLAADVDTVERLVIQFEKDHRGQLDTQLGRALRDRIVFDSLCNQVGYYLMLRQTVDMTNEAIRTRDSEINERLTAVYGEHLSWWDLEICALSDEAIEQQAAADETVAKHRPYIKRVRRNKPHLLSEPVEKALAKRSTYGPSSWAEFYDEMESDLRFDFRHPEEDEAERPYTLNELLKVVNYDQDRDLRAKALQVLNDGFAGWFHKLSAQTLNVVVGAKRVNDRDRKYPHPMAARNLSNLVPDKVVESLHEVICTEGAELNQRYYRLKAQLMGLDRLAWSDRNAPLPFEAKQTVSYPDGLKMVIDGYRSFSPTLAELIEKAVANKRLDVPAEEGRRGGAFCATFVKPDGKPASFVFQSYLGEPRDVETLAHELGHYVHGILGGESQGALMHRAPMAYCETASVFGESIVFEKLLAQLEASGDRQGKLALLIANIDGGLNTVVRQIGFSNFERRVHDAGRRLSPEEMNQHWLESTAELYGPDGDVFTYADTDKLWCYVHHFHRPYYVYSYAFGELLTHSLRAQASRLGDRFEPLYLEMLRAGGTKDAFELLAPFGLDPADPEFWRNGLKVSLEASIERAEELARELDLIS
jgi:oligoendopeptidase F